MNRLRLTFLTPLFSKGSYDDRPEVRPPSIRGQLHWWFRALGGNAADEKAIFGGVHGTAVASKIVVRVGDVTGSPSTFDTLPHKRGGDASPKAAFAPGTSCDLHLLARLGGLDDKHLAAFERTLESWLLLGTLGLRGTRAAGSFHHEPLAGALPAAPESLESYRTRCQELLKGAPLRFHLADEPFTSADAARKVVSDTIGGKSDRQGEDSLARIRHPLGRVFGGRKTSPLRFRIVAIGRQYHIAAVWDDRSQVTGNRPGDLPAAIHLLKGSSKRLGDLFADFGSGA